MYTFFLIVHVAVCLILIVVVLLQSSKGGGLAGAFGGTGGAPQQILGTRGMTTLLHKITIYCGAIFFVTSFALFTLTGNRNAASSGSVVSEAARRGEIPATTTAVPEPAADVFSLPETAPGTADDVTAEPQDAGTQGATGDDPDGGSPQGGQGSESGSQEQSSGSQQQGGTGGGEPGP